MRFSKQDLAVIGLIGLSNREIANRTGLTENAVKANIFRISTKMGVENRVAIALIALDNKLVDKIEYYRI